MGVKLNITWLLFLSLKVSELKGDIDASIDLHCYQLIPSNTMNCSWFSKGSLGATTTTTYVLYYRSIKFHPHQTYSEQAEKGQNWLIIGRSNLIHGNNYSVWVKVFSADWNATSNHLNFSLDDIVKPLPPVLDPVEPDSAGALVTWRNPHWSESHTHHDLSCALRYKTSTDQDWTYLHEEKVGQVGHDLEDLKPFTSYEVQARCIPENGHGFWSEWSSSQTFKTPEAAPLGQVDAWQKMTVSENGEPSRILLWKALDPESARGVILDYEITYQDHNKNIRKMLCHCCNAHLPSTAEYTLVSARNSIQKTLPANLSLVQTDLPSPEVVQVLAVPSLGFNVTWKPSPNPHFIQPEEYIVEWEEEILSSKGDTLNWIRKPGSCDGALLRGNFKPKIAYRVGLYALYPQGISLPVSVQAYFKEEAPSAGPQALQDRSISSTVSQIFWQEIPLANRNGHIIGYTLYLKDPSVENLIRMPIAGTWRNYSLSNLKPGTTYQLWMTGSTLAGEGVPSTHHYLSTPGASNWQTIIVCLFVVAFLLILAGIVVFVKYRWVLGLCHKILPPWCWQQIPDPEHSCAVLKLNNQSIALGMDAPTQSLDQSPEGMDLLEIKESPPPEPAPPPARVVNSGYEKRFMPTQEDLQKLV